MNSHFFASVELVLLVAGEAEFIQPFCNYILNFLIQVLPYNEETFICSATRMTGKNDFLSVTVLPHREFQRVHEDYDKVVVKHLLSPKCPGSIASYLGARNLFYPRKKNPFVRILKKIIGQ